VDGIRVFHVTGVQTCALPILTLGCGSWGGNVTSDNVSPVHLIDIKRVAFETKPLSVPKAQVHSPKPAADNARDKRERIAALVDRSEERRGGKAYEGWGLR